MTGMQVKTKVSNSLFIGGDTIDSTARLAEGAFVNSLTQNVKGLLEPVSTVDGKDFFYTSTENASASGDALTDTYIVYDPSVAATDSTTYGNKFSESYGVTKDDVNAFSAGDEAAVGYVDYVFQLKAINTSDSANYINITKMNLTYNGTVDASRAYRLGVFVENITSANPAGDLDEVTANIYTPVDATNFTSGKAVNATNGLGSVTYVSAATPIATVARNSTGYYKVVTRLWLEGEDNTCNNETFMALTSNWDLDLEIKLESATTNCVTNIAKWYKADVSAASTYYDGSRYAWAASYKDELGEAGSTHKVDLQAADNGAYRLVFWEQVKGTLGDPADGIKKIGTTDYYVMVDAESAGALVYNSSKVAQYGYVYGGAA